MDKKINDEHVLTVKQFSEKYGWPSEAALRQYIFKAEQYGLKDAFIRFRGRVLIKPKVFFDLIKDNEK